MAGKFIFFSPERQPNKELKVQNMYKSSTKNFQPGLLMIVEQKPMKCTSALLLPNPMLSVRAVKLVNDFLTLNKNKMSEKKATDFLIECGNPEAFDRTIQSMGAVLCDGGNKGQYVKQDGYYVMRVFGDPGFLKFAIQNQGYGKVIKELPELT